MPRTLLAQVAEQLARTLRARCSRRYPGCSSSWRRRRSPLRRPARGTPAPCASVFRRELHVLARAARELTPSTAVWTICSLRHVELVLAVDGAGGEEHVDASPGCLAPSPLPGRSAAPISRFRSSGSRRSRRSRRSDRLSATQRPLEEIGRFVSGGRPIELVDAGVAKELDLEVVVPVEDMREPGDSREKGYERADLAVDLPGARRARARAQVDDCLRQQPPSRRAARPAAERARGGRDRTGRAITVRWPANSGRRSKKT